MGNEVYCLLILFFFTKKLTVETSGVAHAVSCEGMRQENEKQVYKDNNKNKLNIDSGNTSPQTHRERGCSHRCRSGSGGQPAKEVERKSTNTFTPSHHNNTPNNLRHRSESTAGSPAGWGTSRAESGPGRWRWWGCRGGRTARKWEMEKEEEEEEGKEMYE